jgi:hypothetical protein
MGSFDDFLLKLLGLGGEEGDTTQLEALIRKILLGEEGEGGLLADMLRTALLGDEEGKDGLLTELLRSALLGGEEGENPLMAALQESIIRALLGGEDDEGDSPLARAFNTAIGTPENTDTPLGAAVATATTSIETATNTIFIPSIEFERDDALSKMDDRRLAALREINVARLQALAEIRALLYGDGAGVDTNPDVNNADAKAEPIDAAHVF